MNDNRIPLLNPLLAVLRSRRVVIALVSIAVALLLAAVPVGAQDVSTANPNANANARAVLAYLSGLAGRGAVVGQFGGYGDGNSLDYVRGVMDDLQNMTGRQAALTGWDFDRTDRTHQQSIDEAVEYLTEAWQNGMLVTASWHAGNPCTGGGANLEYPAAPMNLKRVLPGGNCRAAWLASMDVTAAGLQRLEDAGVVVIWRPFHEMNGAWFWWHRGSQADFVALWRDMFDYFTRVKGLDNLLWAYSPNTAWDQWAQRVNYYYPGAEYVDIVGLDHYMRVTEDPLELNAFGSYNDLATLGKPMALLEFGNIPASGQGWDTRNYCWSNLARDLQTRYPQIVLIQAWEWVFRIPYDRASCQSEFMSSGWMITLDELPNFRGNVSVPPTMTATPATPTRTPVVTATPQPTTTATPQPDQAAAVQAAIARYEAAVEAAQRRLIEDLNAIAR